MMLAILRKIIFLTVKDINLLKDINSEERKDKRIIRKLQRELMESKQTIDELETTNSRLRKRVDDVLKSNEKFRAKFQYAQKRIKDMEVCLKSIGDTLNTHISLNKIQPNKISLAQIINHSDVLEGFKDYLRSEYSLENMLFYQDVELFKKLTKYSEIYDRTISLYHKYIEPNAIHEVNISFETRKKISDKLDELMELGDQASDSSCYDIAQEEIIESLERDSIPRFIITFEVSKYINVV